MKRIQVAGFALFAMLASRATLAHEASLAALDAENGFRGVKFGSKFTDFKDLKPLEDGSWMFFSRDGETLKLGTAELNTIGYGFYKDELGAVIVKVAGANCERLLAALQTSYGKPRQPNEYIKSYFWSGERVYLSFDRNDITDKCYATFISMPVHEKASEDERRAAEQNGEKSGPIHE